MKEKKYCVYKHTNKSNQKSYIGMTCLNPCTRWQGGEGYYTQKKFYKDILKYGWDNFTHEIIYTDLTKEEAAQKEKELIIKYDSIKNGYNTNCKLVHCVELDKYFITLMEAANELGVDWSSISKVCLGKRKTAGGYHWRYANE